MALRGGVTIDMMRMNAITRISVEDLDVTVQAGVTRRQLDARLRPEGVFFSVDPGADATIGGMIATGASGTTTVRYGAMRENVLSLLVITPDGELVRTRSRARKSSAGLDLTRLFIGSEGTLGLIVEATLRVHPTPEAMYAAVLSFGTMEDAVTTVTEVAQYGIPVARIELADELTIDMINKHFEFDMPLAPTLFLEFHGGEAEVAAQAESVREIAQEHGLRGLRGGRRRVRAPAAVARAARRLRGDEGDATGLRGPDDGRLRPGLRARRERPRGAGGHRRARAEGGDRRARRRRQLPRRDRPGPRPARGARRRGGVPRPRRAPRARPRRDVHRRARRRLRQVALPRRGARRGGRGRSCARSRPRSIPATCSTRAREPRPRARATRRTARPSST